MNGFNRPSDSTPLPYTASPVQLVLSELWLIRDIIVHYPASFPGLLRPWFSLNTEDELCLVNPRNVRSILLHVTLLVAQPVFVLGLVYALVIPVPPGVFLAGIILGLSVNYYFCKLLNGDGSPQTSRRGLLYGYPDHPDEHWIFINGVSVGRDWFQSNLDTLSLIFRRPITGVHNITYGIIFDLIECLIQRDWGYATNDIRTGYAAVKKALLHPNHKKVVLLLHSQGGIEGGAILDWLLADLPADKLRKLEIYTFGSAANHFNNPDRVVPPGDRNRATKLGLIRRIEHYTNCGDFVARFGILGFIHLPTGSPGGNAGAAIEATGPTHSNDAHGNDNNRFKGRLFKRHATGHMLNQHYLACMFKRETYVREDGTTAERVADHNAFMDAAASPWDDRVDAQTLGWRAIPSCYLAWWATTRKEAEPVNGVDTADSWESMIREDGMDLSLGRAGGVPDSTDMIIRPRDLSWLWKYRNGMSPKDDEEDNGKEERE